MFESWKLRKKIQCNERVQSEQRNIGMTSICVIMGGFIIYLCISTHLILKMLTLQISLPPMLKLTEESLGLFYLFLFDLLFLSF